MLILALSSCAQIDEIDTSNYPSFLGEPTLEEVAVHCLTDSDGAYLEVSARTHGWHEYAAADLWLSPTGLVLQDVAELETEGFLRDETCDVMANHPTFDGVEWINRLAMPSCDEADLSTVTLLVRANFEEGCAGCAVRGTLADAIVNLGADALPWDGDEDCGDDDLTQCAPITLDSRVEDCPAMATTRW